MREMKLLIFLKKEFFRIKVIYLKQKKKKNQKNHKNKRNQKKNYVKTNFLKILRKNQKVLTMIYLKNILNLNYLTFWQKHYLKQNLKGKIMT